MLDWNPLLRGRRYTDPSHPSPLMAFEVLDQILQTRIISIFWVDNLTELSYAINDLTTIEMVHEWIERDTGVSQHYQSLIMSRGTIAEFGKHVLEFFNENEPIFAYLFSKINESKPIERLVENYPEMVEAMLANPRAEMEYHVRKQMWAQSVFFVSQQVSLYWKLLDALKVHS